VILIHILNIDWKVSHRPAAFSRLDRASHGSFRRDKLTVLDGSRGRIYATKHVCKLVLDPGSLWDHFLES